MIDLKLVMIFLLLAPGVASKGSVDVQAGREDFRCVAEIGIK